MEVETRKVKRLDEEEGLLLTCGSCKKAIALQPGDLIYGGEWYHPACWVSERDAKEIQDRLLEEHRAQLKF
jgi:hypothetical protein